MDLLERVTQDMKQAMRDGDTVARDTLRMVRGAMKDSDDPMDELLRAVKTRKESLAQYQEAGRDDLAAKERKEIEVLERYLPKQLDDEEAREAISQVIRELGAVEKKDMGRVMKELMSRYQGQLDGKVASRLVGEHLK